VDTFDRDSDISDIIKRGRHGEERVILPHGPHLISR
jgi:hypothetical protein